MGFPGQPFFVIYDQLRHQDLKERIDEVRFSLGNNVVVDVNRKQRKCRERSDDIDP